MSAHPLRLFRPESAGSPPPHRIALETVHDVLVWFPTIDPADGNPKALKEARRQRALFDTQYGMLRLDDAMPGHLAEFIAKQRRVKSNWTKRRINSAIQHAFNEAERLIKVRNPFRGLSYPEGEDGRDWTDEEYRAALRHGSPAYRRLLVALRFSGMRPGEARSLQWPNLRADCIRFDKHKTKKKTRKPRVFPYNRVLIKLFAWIRRHDPHASHVFLNTYNRPWSANALEKYHRELRQRIGLPPDVKLHGGRHTFACQAILNGVDVASLQQLLNHEKLSTTQRYLHLSGKVDHLQGAMDKAVASKRRPEAATPLFDRIREETPLFDDLE